MEWNDVYDEHKNPTGRLHRRGSPWGPGDYGLVVNVRDQPKETKAKRNCC